MKKNALEFWVGLFVLLGAAAIGFLAFRAAGGQSFGKSSQTYTVYADFSDIGGLTVLPRRPVSYGKVAPEEAREIFIRGALVAQESNLQTAFFAHNKKLIKEITELEHKSRKQDVLVDDEALFAFYNERLPELVWKDAKGGVWGSEEGGQLFRCRAMIP